MSLTSYRAAPPRGYDFARWCGSTFHPVVKEPSLNKLLLLTATLSGLRDACRMCLEDLATTYSPVP
jgi:hypothetical protein